MPSSVAHALPYV